MNTYLPQNNFAQSQALASSNQPGGSLNKLPVYNVS